MKKAILLLLILVFVLFTTCQAKHFKQGQQVEKYIDTAIAQFQAGIVQKATLSTMDALLITVPYSNYSGEMESKLKHAADLLKINPINNQAMQLIRETYLGIKLPTPPAVAGKSHNNPGIAPLAEILKTKLETARSMAREGNTNKVVESLLEGLLLLAPPANL